MAGSGGFNTVVRNPSPFLTLLSSVGFVQRQFLSIW